MASRPWQHIRPRACYSRKGGAVEGASTAREAGGADAEAGVKKRPISSTEKRSAPARLIPPNSSATRAFLGIIAIASAHWHRLSPEDGRNDVALWSYTLSTSSSKSEPPTESAQPIREEGGRPCCASEATSMSR
jgi:hypothetical protein